MKPTIILIILFILLIGCTRVQEPTINTTQKLILNEQDLQQIGMRSNGTDCKTEEYETSEFSPLAQYSTCFYTINNHTEIIIELKKFTNFEDLNGSYQYDSSHLFSVQGLISENAYGDFSRFRVSNENDYGGQYNDPNIYYYHLWIVKDKYLIHITSKGKEEAKEYIAKTGRLILGKF